MTKKILLIFIACLAAHASVYSFDPKATDSTGHKKGPGVGGNHWLQGKAVTEKLNYDSLWNNAVSFEKSSEAQKLVENCIEAYGGQAHLEKINSLKLNFDLFAVLMQKDQKVVQYFQTGFNHRIEILNGEDLSLARVLNKDKAWAKTTEVSQEIDTHNFKKEIYDYLSCTMPLGIKTGSFSSVKYGTRNDDPLEYIYLKKNDSLLTIVGINPEDKMINKIEGIVLHGDKRFVFINLYSDFQKFNGYLFPVKKNFISMGLEVGQSTLTSVEINPALDENLFAIPIE